MIERGLFPITSRPIEADRELIIDLAQELIRFPSVNPPGNEQPVAEFLAKRMEELGIEAELQPIEEGRANVIGRLRGEGQGHLAFTGHLDVVPPGGQSWQFDPFRPQLVGDRLGGRGSCDMKGGVAAIVAAVAALKRSGFRPRADVVIACTAGEEGGMLGAKHMVERRSLEGSRYLVVAEPSDLNVFIGEKGVLWSRIRALGRTAHGSMPWLGANAVSYMARLIWILESHPFPYQESALLGKPTVSVNVIHGGNKVNVIPDLCEIEVDMRLVPGQDHQNILATMQGLAETVAHEYHPELRVEMDLMNYMAALETNRGDRLVEATVESVQHVRGVVPEVGGVAFGTDAAQLGPGFNIPMVICGPGSPGMAHQPNESVDVVQLVQAAEIYIDLCKRLLR